MSGGNMQEWADLIVAVATVVAVLIAAWELRASAQTSGQTHAREAWLRYLELGLANPQFGTTKFALKHLKINSVEVMWGLGSADSERYWWFLDIMMEAAESLVNYFPEKEWQNTIKYNLLLHRDALVFIKDDESKFYSEKLSDLIEEICHDSYEFEGHASAAIYSRSDPGLSKN
jgi:hypothetical protein